VRVRILIHPTGPIDEIALDHFHVGGVYELGTEVASLFLAQGWAELVSDDNSPVFVRPPPLPQGRRSRPLVLIVDDEHCPDLIVLDLDMPVMDGWQFRTEQRFFSEKKRAAVPVLLMTGIDDAGRIAATLQAVGLVQKPIDPDDLLEAVSAAVAKTS
jgi:CheY-like chemotaxis protein